MGPVRMFLTLWLTLGLMTLALELSSKWGNFWRKFDQLEKVPEARFLGGPTTFLMCVIVITLMWPIRMYYFAERLVKFLWTKMR